MVLIHNSSFRLDAPNDMGLQYTNGIYRVIAKLSQQGQIVTALIKPEPEEITTADTKCEDQSVRNNGAKKPPLVTKLIWMEISVLTNLFTEQFAHPHTIERENLPLPKGKNLKLFQKRIQIMKPLLDVHLIEEELLRNESLAGLIKDITTTHNVSRAHVYRLLSLLFLDGFHEESLRPRSDQSGGRGQKRPCYTGVENKKTRRKPGRKTHKQKMGLLAGKELEPEQPGMSTIWESRILNADRKIPNPKPLWPARHQKIILLGFCESSRIQNGEILTNMPAKGTYPSLTQTKHVIQRHESQLNRIAAKTTPRHLNSSRRGRHNRNWQGVSGPGHQWEIDSTISEVFLRSSVNPEWLVGRPIVYVVVDTWSTAIVGFHVCLTGPSWSTASISLFNSASPPGLMNSLWRHDFQSVLDPAPTLPRTLLCDRGEYLSNAARLVTKALEMKASYTPPYRGDLKGLVEVLHRITKDDQKLFIPGAFDNRREELELRGAKPSDAQLTVREYVHFLEASFREYNLTANRENRMDSSMYADNVYPSPAGLWSWGHKAGIGTERHFNQTDLFKALLPAKPAFLGRDSVKFAGLDYMAPIIKEMQLTTIARNIGGQEIQAIYYPGSVGKIWTPSLEPTGLTELELLSCSRASTDITHDEWDDCLAFQRLQRPDQQHSRLITKLDSHRKKEAIVNTSREKSKSRESKLVNPTPSIREARRKEAEFPEALTPLGTTHDDEPPPNNQAKQTYANVIRSLIKNSRTDGR